jgi:hypothetical protein
MNDNKDEFTFKIPPDTYNSSGSNVKELREKDKDEVISILRVEFLPN